jgi:hypothetical protein
MHIFPPIKQALKYDPVLDSSSTEEYNEIDSQKTVLYLEDENIPIDLSRRAYVVLRFLVQNNAYKAMNELYRIWSQKGYQSLANEIILYIRSFPERIYNDEIQVSAFYRCKIMSSVHRSVLNSFFAIETEALGD